MTSIKNNGAGLGGGLSPSVKRSLPVRKTGVATPLEAEVMTPDMLRPPARRGFQVIPSADVLDQLIGRAVEAFKRGMIWDRGSILNLLV